MAEPGLRKQSRGERLTALRADLASRLRSQAPNHVSPGRHFGGLAAAGLIALAADLIVLWSLIAIGVSPLVGRVVSIALAMVVSWLINRTVSFDVKTRPKWSEFAKFAAVSWTAQAVNYAVFAIVLYVAPSAGPTLAVLIGCGVSIFVAYVGFRFAVFR